MSAAFLLMLITIISKITGFLRELFFGYFMGTSAIKDLYVIATSIPSVLFGFVFSAVVSSFIPMFNKVESLEGKEKADKFTTNVSNALLIVATIAVIIGLIFARPIVKLFARGWQGDKLDYTVTFTRIVIFSIYATAFNAPFSGYLNIHDDFLNPAINGIIMNAIIITACFIAFFNNNWLILAYGYVLAYFIQYMNFIPALRKKGYKHSKYIDLKSPYLKELVRLGIPIIISVSADKISSIIDKTIASSLFEEGGVSALDYASKITSLVDGVIIVSVVTAAYPQLTRLAQNNELAKLKKTVSSTLISTFVLVIPAVVGIFVLAEPITSLIYERGAFNEESTLITGGALRWYAPSLIGLVVYSVMTRSFYSLKDTITPVKMMIVQVAVDVPLNFLLSSIMGLNGLAFSSSIGIIASGFYAILAFRKKFGKFNLKETGISILKILFISIIMGFIAQFMYEFLSVNSQTLGLILSIIVAGLSYLVMILFANISEVKKIVNSIYWKFKKKKKNKKK